MQPSPTAETRGPEAPRRRNGIVMVWIPPPILPPSPPPLSRKRERGESAPGTSPHRERLSVAPRPRKRERGGGEGAAARLRPGHCFGALALGCVDGGFLHLRLPARLQRGHGLALGRLGFFLLLARPVIGEPGA